MNASALLFNETINHECQAYALKCTTQHVLSHSDWQSWASPTIQGLLHSPKCESFDVYLFIVYLIYII